MQTCRAITRPGSIRRPQAQPRNETVKGETLGDGNITESHVRSLTRTSPAPCPPGPRREAAPMEAFVPTIKVEEPDNDAGCSDNQCDASLRAVDSAEDAAPLKCNSCSQRFANKELLARHVCQYFKDGTYCNPCGKDFPCNADLRIHLRTLEHRHLCPLSCEVCFASFVDSSELALHRRSHERRKLSGRPGTAIRLDKHRKIHEDSRPHQCPKCSKRFTKRGTLRIHLRSHEKQGPFRCLLCQTEYRTDLLLRVHERRHVEKRSFECDVCPWSFVNASRLRRHAATHSGGDRFECSTCPKAFSSRGALKTHERSHDALEHRLAQNLRSALSCEASPPSDVASGIDSDVPIPSNGDELSFECGICSMEFVSYGSLEVHTRTHTTELPFACDRCPAIFASEGALRSHALTHTPECPLLSSCPSERDVEGPPVAEPRFECSECTRTFGSLANLEAHTGAHFVQRPCTCRRCGKTFSTRAALRIHKKKLGPFKCTSSSEPSYGSSGIAESDADYSGSPESEPDYSGSPESDPNYSASSESDTDSDGSLNHDVKSDTDSHKGLEHDVEADENGVPFRCEVCSAPFFTKATLALHMRRRTCKEYLKCPSCPMMFATSHERRRHRIIHTTTNLLFKCDHCPRTFARERAAMLHCNLSHVERPLLTCLKCPATFDFKQGLERHAGTHRDQDDEAGTTRDTDGPTKTRRNADSQPGTSRDLDAQTRPGCDAASLAQAKSGVRRVFKCGQCRLTFATDVDLAEHVLCHRVAYECGTCYLSFPTAFEFKVHAKTHEAPYRCQACGKLCPTRWRFAAHLKSCSENQPCPSVSVAKRRWRRRVLKKKKLPTKKVVEP